MFILRTEVTLENERGMKKFIEKKKKVTVPLYTIKQFVNEAIQEKLERENNKS